MTGSAGQKRVPKAFLENYQIELPTVDMQEQQVDALKKISNLIQKRKQQLEKLDELVKARFVELFSDPVSNPLSWEKRTLKEVCVKLNDGTHFSPESYETGQYKYVTAKNIKLSRYSLVEKS